MVAAMFRKCSLTGAAPPRPSRSPDSAFNAAVPCSRLSSTGMASTRTLVGPNSSTSKPHRLSSAPWASNALLASGGISMMSGVRSRWLSSAPAISRAEIRSYRTRSCATC